MSEGLRTQSSMYCRTCERATQHVGVIFCTEHQPDPCDGHQGICPTPVLLLRSELARSEQVAEQILAHADLVRSENARLTEAVLSFEQLWIEQTERADRAEAEVEALQNRYEFPPSATKGDH